MQKLYNAIRSGFQGRVETVLRGEFRARCGIDEPDLHLIPLNFFLNNTVRDGENWVSADELVFQAVSQPHSPQFDRLALFAFHLNLAGARIGQNGVSAPASWAQEYVTQRLWRSGGWEAAQLELPEMDDFLIPLLDATPGVQTKCRSNYRHLYELCGYLPSATPFINTGYEHWLASAVFLALDRHLLVEPNASSAPSGLVRWLGEQDLFKLIGAPSNAVSLLPLVQEYCRLGRLDRFMRPVRVRAPLPLHRPSLEERRQQAEDEQAFIAAGAMPSRFDWLLEEAEEQSQIVRRQQLRHAQIRSRSIVILLKKLYQHRCLICENTLQVGYDPDRFYSEGAHIQPVGEPHNGPDVASNMLVLCPNHHLQFDNGIISIRREGEEYVVTSKIPHDPLQGRSIHFRAPHRPGDQFLDWHHRYWFGAPTPGEQQ